MIGRRGALLAGAALILTLAIGLGEGPRDIPRHSTPKGETMTILAPPRPPTRSPFTPTPRITPAPAPLTPSPWPTPTLTPAPATPEPSPSRDARLAGVERVLAGSPLEPYAAAMLEAADVAGIDWRLLPAIAVLESSAGRHACGGNAWGYASCRVEFATFDEGISLVAATLARPPYSGLDVEGALCMWVAGRACDTAHAAAYRDRALALFARMAAP